MIKYLSILFIFLFSCQKELGKINNEDNSNDVALQSKPNVIIVLIDDLGFETIKANGGETYHTPNIDLLANTGTNFINCYATPLCSPSRVELLTGKYNFRNYNDWGNLSTDNKTIGNLMKDAGYETGIFGKWQLGGGDTSIKSFGFDNYIVHDALGRLDRGNRYKNPHLYTHAGFLPDDSTLNKYGDDIVQDSLFSFIDNSISDGKPFFAYYPVMLCHEPFQPTPDDAAFATWNTDNSDRIYYSSMVRYMDKLIGQLMFKLRESKIDKKTIVIFTADNGTPKVITSKFNGISIEGGKGKTIMYGGHVPLYVVWGSIAKVGVDSSLIDFSDFLPTLCDISSGSILNYGVTDGVSFYHNILNRHGKNRQWSYFDFNAHPEDETDTETVSKHSIWVQDARYKRYDSIAYPAFRGNKFYDFTKTPLEDNGENTPTSLFTDEQLKRNRLFKNVLETIKN